MCHSHFLANNTCTYNGSILVWWWLVLILQTSTDVGNIHLQTTKWTQSCRLTLSWLACLDFTFCTHWWQNVLVFSVFFTIFFYILHNVVTSLHLMSVCALLWHWAMASWPLYIIPVLFIHLLQCHFRVGDKMNVVVYSIYIAFHYVTFFISQGTRSICRAPRPPRI